MAEEEDKVLELAHKRFGIAVESEDENRIKELSDLKFLAASPDDNWQWPEEVLASRRPTQGVSARPCLTINPLPQHVRQVTNEQRMNRPQIKVQPVDDKADPEVAEIYNGLIRHIQTASEADLAYDTACEAQVAHGLGYFRILTEYCGEMSFEQDIRIRPIKDRFKVYYDPHIQHPAGEDARWAFVIEDLPKEEYEMAHPEEPVDWNEAGIGDQSRWFPGEETVRLAEYFALEDIEKTLCLYPGGVALFKDSPQALAYAGVKPLQERKTKVTRCIWRKITGQKVLKEIEMPCSHIPIVRVVGNEWIVDGEPVVSGIVRNAKDPVRQYNYWASKETEVIALAPIIPFIGAAGQFEGFEERWKKANQLPYAYLEYNAVVGEDNRPLPPPQRSLPPLPPAGITQAKLAAADDIKRTTGFYDASLGERSNETSGRAINARKIESDIGTYHYVDNLARAIRYGGRIIVEMIPGVYNTRRIARILGEDGETEQVFVDPGLPVPHQDVTDKDSGKALGKVYNLGVGKYDVVVTVGPSYTTKRQETAELLTQVLQGNKELMAVMGDLYFKFLDVPGAQEIAERMKKMLPPALQGNDEEEQEPVIPTPQGPMPASQVAQLVQQLMAQLEQAAATIKAAGDLNGRAQDLEKQQAELQKILDAIEVEQAQLMLEKKLAVTEVENRQLKATEAMRKTAEQLSAEQQAQMQPLSPPQESPALAEQLKALGDALVQVQATVAQAVGEIASRIDQSKPVSIRKVVNENGQVVGGVAQYENGETRQITIN